jgi:putative addiction module killer protein
MIDVRRYQRSNGSVPVSDWLGELRDARARAKLGIRFDRVSLGIFGDANSVGEGVLELRENIGPGYRVYLGRRGNALVILLCGGDKSTQDADIKRAKDYWQDWKRRNV